jgi:hypothetical protein
MSILCVKLPFEDGKLLFCNMSTRRKFLFDCSTAMAALALFPLKSAGQLAQPRGDFKSLVQLSYRSLAGQLNTLFRVHLSPRQVVELKLLKAQIAPPTPIRPGHPPPGDAGNEKFSLIFIGPKAVLLASAIHQFEHGRLGRFEMYIGQIGPQDREKVRYEAVFNQPAPSVSARATLI